LGAAQLTHAADYEQHEDQPECGRDADEAEEDGSEDDA
jgi:hypothetical protein